MATDKWKKDTDKLKKGRGKVSRPDPKVSRPDPEEYHTSARRRRPAGRPAPVEYRICCVPGFHDGFADIVYDVDFQKRRIDVLSIGKPFAQTST